MELEFTSYTKETGIAICRVRQGSRSQWRHVDTNDERHAYVGQAYGSRKALMADHLDYLLRAGWLKDPNQDASELCLATCSECSEQTSYIIGCPDGAELCPSCFDEGSH